MNKPLATPLSLAAGKLFGRRVLLAGQPAPRETLESSFSAAVTEAYRSVAGVAYVLNKLRQVTPCLMVIPVITI